MGKAADKAISTTRPASRAGNAKAAIKTAGHATGTARIAQSTPAEAQHPARRGFAAMDEEKRRAIARKGGESVPAEKRSFFRNRSLAAEAGRKGGQNVADENRSFSRDRSLAAHAGQKGGKHSTNTRTFRP